MLLRKILFSLLFTAVTITPFASTETDFQQWNLLLINGKIQNTDTLYWLEGQARFGDDVSNFTQGFFRPALGRQITNHSSLWFGYGWFYTSSPLAKPSNEEQRLWQQHTYRDTVLNLEFMNRARLEQRFFQNNAQVGWRFREAMRFQKSLSWGPKLYAVVMNEVFIHLRDLNKGDISPTFDQNRLYAGIGHKFSDSLTMEMGYIRQDIERNNRADFSANIATINAFVNFS